MPPALGVVCGGCLFDVLSGKTKAVDQRHVRPCAEEILCHGCVSRLRGDHEGGRAALAKRMVEIDSCVEGRAELRDRLEIGACGGVVQLLGLLPSVQHEWIC